MSGDVADELPNVDHTIASLIGHRRILNERYVSFLTGVAYTGPYEVPALTLVVDNAAAAQSHRCRCCEPNRLEVGGKVVLVAGCYVADIILPPRLGRSVAAPTPGLFGEPVIAGSDLQHCLFGGWVTRAHRDGSGFLCHLGPSLCERRLEHFVVKCGKRSAVPPIPGT